RLPHTRPGGVPQRATHQLDRQGVAPGTRQRPAVRYEGASMIKNGTRLQSQVCDTQVIVVRTAESLDDLCAGGFPMVPLDSQSESAGSSEFSLNPEFTDGNLMGKRYVDETGA